MLTLKPTICIANNKGGVGKTTTTKGLAEYFSLVLKKKILLIDIDPQSSLSARFLSISRHPKTDFREPPLHPSYDPNNLIIEGEELETKKPIYWDGKSSIADIFWGKQVRPYRTRIPTLDIAPADEAKLMQAESVKKQDIADKVYTQIYNFIKDPNIQAEYDAFIIDTPPAKGPLTIAAFKAASHLLVPLEIELQAIEGLQGILTLWKQEAVQRPTDYPIQLLGILPSKVHSRRSLDSKLYENLKESLGEDCLLPFKIMDRKQFPEADLNNKSILELPDSDDAKTEFIQFCKFIARKVFNE